MPVVLIMAPVGTLVLTRIPAEVLLRVLVARNLLQLAWCNLRQPSVERATWSLGSTAIAFVGFSWTVQHLARRRRAALLAA